MTAISGVGESKSRSLEEQGLKRVADVANASVDQVAAAEGFGPVSAEQVIAAAAALLAAAADTVKQPQSKKGTKSARVKKDPMKGKKGKKKKDKKKKKNKKIKTGKRGSNKKSGKKKKGKAKK